MRFYIVVFDRVGSKDYRVFHDEFVGHRGIRRWWHYVKSCYIVGTESLTARQIGDHFAEVATKYGIPKTHLVMSVNLKTRWGWLSADAWKWIDAQEDR